MTDEPFILGVIPARSGSKGVKQKNVREVGGKPLIHYTIEAAAECPRLSDVIVSTDSREIANVANEAGGKTPFLRPKGLATDTAPTLDVMQHAIREYEARNTCTVDVSVLLQPTTPLRNTDDITTSIEMYLRNEECRSVVTCYETTDVHPNIMYEQLGNVLTPLRKDPPERRQEFRPVFVRNGAVYVSERKLLMEDEKLYSETPVGHIMPRERSINIDEPFDLTLAEFLLTQHD